MYEVFWSVTTKLLFLVTLGVFLISPVIADENEEWTIDLIGVINKTLSKSDFEELAATSSASFTDEAGDIFSGVPLITLIGLVDDGEGDASFNSDAAKTGYTVEIIGGDGYSAEIESANISEEAEIIVCNLQNNESFASSDVPPYPLKVYGADITMGQSVGNIAVIELKGISVSEPELNDEEDVSEDNSTMFAGEIELSDGTIAIITGSGKTYDVNEKTPLGALAKAAQDGGYTFEVADHSYEDREILLLDAINDNRWEKDTSDLVVAINGEIVEDWGTDTEKFYNMLPLMSGDVVTYLVGVPPVTLENGIKIVELTVL
ncbi:hypothetical protein ACKUB1_12740 [Methanospirillum stamsii]|uniref:Uncharacterized protein n=1 Tax=Methanospirillum stamsii TaxID=1277351 RepID=A0A2V2NCJ0_9EURY|nr:hypothetical protein [Methanospirillum stamsii]PWR76305.1 hypothetical protein DLD82_00400 [Methanospirillum stamsii]